MRDLSVWNVVQEAWQGAENLQLCSSFHHKLRVWNKNVFGICQSRIEHLEHRISLL